MNNQTRFQGKPVELAGKFITPGAAAPDFALTRGDLSSFTLADDGGKKLLLNIFPSIDTPVCSMSVRKFNEAAAALKDALVLCISRDLPFAQSRFCGVEGIDRVVTLSDFQYSSTFGIDYGVLMEDGPLRGLFARSVVVIGSDGRVAYSQLVDDIVHEPDYEQALKALNDAL